MPRTRNDNTGLYEERYPLELFAEELADRGSGTTSEIAEGVGCARDTAYKKLRTLEEEGEISSRMVATARLWSPRG